MDWWDDLWLNEGFATFMAYIGVKETEPTMEFVCRCSLLTHTDSCKLTTQVMTFFSVVWFQFSQFASVEIYSVMPEDSVVSSHPIIVPVNRPEEITAVFDSISYNKVRPPCRIVYAFLWVRTKKFIDGTTPNTLDDY